METAERSTPPTDRAPQASDAETPRSAEPRRPAAAPAPPPAPAPKNPRPAARTFTRRYILDVPLYTAPLALLLLGLGWQLTGGANEPRLTLFGLVSLGLAAATVVVQRLLPPEALQPDTPPPRLWALVAFLVFAPVAALPLAATTTRSFAESNLKALNIIAFYIILLLTFYVFRRTLLPYLRLKLFMLSIEIFCIIPSIYIGIDNLIFAVTIWAPYLAIAIMMPSILVVRAYERRHFSHAISPSALSLAQALIIIGIYYNGLPWMTGASEILFFIASVSIIFVLSFILRRRFLSLAQNPRRENATRRSPSATAPYALLPAFLLTAALFGAVALLDRWLPQLVFALVQMAAWPILLGYIFLFASPLPRLLLEAELRGAPVPGASYSDFRRLSRLGVSDDLARRGTRAIVAAALGGLARWIRALPAHLAPWIVVPLVAAVTVLPWSIWLDGASPAPLVLPIAVWAAARWGRSALPPLAVALVPHVISLSLPVPEGSTLVPELLGAPGFVAATLFWARFTADADLRRRLLTQERFGLDALLALALLAGCLAGASFSFSQNMAGFVACNLLWIAGSLVLVWGLSRAPIGGVILVLTLLVGLEAAIYDLGLLPIALPGPLQFGSGELKLWVEMPRFGLNAKEAGGLVLIALISRFALRAGMSERARRSTRFASPLTRTVAAALCMLLSFYSLDLLSSGRGGSILDYSAGPEEPFLPILGFMLGLWLPRALGRLPRMLLVGWSPIGVFVGAGIALMSAEDGVTTALALLIENLSTPGTLVSIATFLAAIVFGLLVRLRSGDAAWESAQNMAAQATPAPANSAHPAAGSLYAGPSALLNDILGRDRRVSLVRVIDATFAVPEARRMKEPGITAGILVAAAPRPFAEVFEPPVRAPSPARLVLGRLGMLLLVLNVSTAAEAVTASLRRAAAPPPTTDTASPTREAPPQRQQFQQQPATLRDNGGKAPPSAR